MQFLHKTRNNLQYLDAFICLLSFIASQRFFCPSLSTLAFLPLALFTFFFFLQEKQMHGRFLPALLILLLSIADEGGGQFPNSPAILIKIVIFPLFLLCISRIKFSLGWKMIPCLFLIPPLVFFLLNKNTDQRIAYLCGIFSILFILIHSAKSFKFQISTVNFFKYSKLYFNPYIFGELLNIVAANFGILSYEYLSYTSLKFLIVIPFLLSIERGFIKESFFYGLVTLILLLEYQTRTIFILTVLFTLFLVFERQIVKKRYLNILALFTSIFVFFKYFLPKIHYFNSKNFELLISLSQFNFFSLNGIFNLFKSLDHYRFYENKLFFSQSPQFLIFGNGLGYKFPDTLNLLKLSNINDTAYSIAELQNSYIVSFHDSWVFFGVNFGLFFVIYVYGYLLVIMFDKKININTDLRRIFGFLILMLLFFSYSKATTYFIAFMFAAFLLPRKS